MKNKNSFTYTAKIRDKKGNERNIEKISRDGLGVVAEFYNQKYPEDGKINLVLVDMDDDCKKLPLDDIAESLATKAAKQIEEVQSDNKDNKKIILTILSDKENGHLDHSDPIFLSKEKMIMLRDFYAASEEFSESFYSKIATKLGVELIRQHNPSKEIEGAKRTSIQSAPGVCHLISAGILKEIKNNNVDKISNLENGYIPPAELLKYSQSTTHISALLGDAQNEPLKKGTSLIEYVKSHKKTQTDSRIQKKFDRFISELKQFDEATPDTNENHALFAKRILDQRKNDKLNNKDGDSR